MMMLFLMITAIGILNITLLIARVVLVRRMMTCVLVIDIGLV